MSDQRLRDLASLREALFFVDSELTMLVAELQKDGHPLFASRAQRIGRWFAEIDKAGAALAAQEGGEPPLCTGITASWCAIHGDCICPRGADGELHLHEEAGVNPDCPLHGADTNHGEWELRGEKKAAHQGTPGEQPETPSSVVARHPTYPWVVCDIDSDADYEVVRVAPSVDEEMVIWVRVAHQGAAQPVAWRSRRKDWPLYPQQRAWIYWYPGDDPPHHDPRRSEDPDIKVEAVYTVAHPEAAPQPVGEPWTKETLAALLCPGYSHTARGVMSEAKRKAGKPCLRCLYWAEQILDRFLAHPLPNAVPRNDEAALARIGQLLAMQKGWDSYGAEPITMKAADAALKLRACVAEDPEFVPCPNGGIQLEWHNRGFDVELELHPDGTLHEEGAVPNAVPEGPWKALAYSLWFAWENGGLKEQHRPCNANDPCVICQAFAFVGNRLEADRRTPTGALSGPSSRPERLSRPDQGVGGPRP